jgi:hypothetical protein
MRDINNFLLYSDRSDIVELNLDNGEEVLLDYTNNSIISKVNCSIITQLDVVFPITH